MQFTNSTDIGFVLRFEFGVQIPDWDLDFGRGIRDLTAKDVRF